MVLKYAPENDDAEKRLFAQTDKGEHLKVFGEIVKGINNNGLGLEDIKFSYKGGEGSYTFLTEPEVQHLKDVALVVKYFKWSSIFFAILGFFAFFKICCLRRKPFKPSFTIITTFIVICCLVAGVYFSGAEKMFYHLHELVFQQHQWFFYYEESLMTTFIHAPFLFGYIASLLVILSFFIYSVLLTVGFFLSKLLR